VSDRCRVCSSVDPRGQLYLQAEIAWKFTDIGDHQLAKTTSRLILEDHAAPADIKISALGTIACVQQLQSEYPAAVHTSHEALMVCRQFPEDFLIQEGSIRIMKNLGFQYRQMNNHVHSCHYYWLALAAACRSSSFDHAEIIVFFLDLRQTLELFGDHWGLERLEREYGRLIREVEEESQSVPMI
jgi:hypothetical protein